MERRVRERVGIEAYFWYGIRDFDIFTLAHPAGEVHAGGFSIYGACACGCRRGGGGFAAGEGCCAEGGGERAPRLGKDGHAVQPGGGDSRGEGDATVDAEV